MSDVRDAMRIGQDSAGRLVQRPLSPHLQVYRPQITSVLSILHRMTGVALTGGAALLCWWLVAAASGPAAWGVVRGFTRSPVGLLLLFGWTVALMYHTLNGIRHLAWDGGHGFSLKATHASGWAVVAGTVVLTLLLWAAGFAIF